MYSFSEEGELLEDLSADPIIPGVMGQGSLVVREGKIYAVGWRKFNTIFDWRIQAFDGVRWSKWKFC